MGTARQAPGNQPVVEGCGRNLVKLVGAGRSEGGAEGTKRLMSSSRTAQELLTKCSETAHTYGKVSPCEIQMTFTF